MANRFPLILDIDDGNKLKELPVGDNLNLQGSGIVNAGTIQATGLTLAGVTYNPFSGSWNDLTDKPSVVAQDTDELPEGTTNLYHTAERVQDVVAAMLTEGVGIDLVYDDDAGTLSITNTGGGGGQAGEIEDLSDVTLTTPSTNQTLKWQGNTQSFVNGFINYTEVVGTPNLASVATTGSYTSLTDRPNLVVDIDDLADVDTTSTPPTTGQVLKWNGTNWAPAADITEGGAGLDADTLDGQDSAYYLNYNNLSNRPTIFDGDWGSLTGTPTTLAGYGITDAVSRLGSVTLTGALSVTNDGGVTIGQDDDAVFKIEAGIAKIISDTLNNDLALYARNSNGVQPAIYVDISTSRVGIFKTAPQYNLDIDGTFKATTLYGDGSNLTNIDLDQVITAGSSTTQPFSTGTLTSATANTSDLGSTSNKWNNVYANNFHGDGSNLTNVSATAAWADITGKPTFATVATSGAYGDLTGTPTIPSALTDLGISDGTNGQVLTTDGAGNFTFADGGDSIGNFTFSSGTIDTDDSSGITITPAVTTSSDLTVENNLTVNNTLYAENIVTTATGTPTIESNSSINLSATDRVTINKSPLNLASFTSTDRDALSATNGDVIYNTTTNKFQGYANGAWVDLH